MSLKKIVLVQPEYLETIIEAQKARIAFAVPELIVLFPDESITDSHRGSIKGINDSIQVIDKDDFQSHLPKEITIGNTFLAEGFVVEGAEPVQFKNKAHITELSNADTFVFGNEKNGIPKRFFNCGFPVYTLPEAIYSVAGAMNIILWKISGRERIKEYEDLEEF